MRGLRHRYLRRRLLLGLRLGQSGAGLLRLLRQLLRERLLGLHGA